MKTFTLHHALLEAKHQGIDRLDAQALLCHVIHHSRRNSASRAWLISHADEALLPAEQTHWQEALARRVGGEPLAYIVGEKEFFSLNLSVNASVLIPRPDTEILVQWALEILMHRQHTNSSPQVIDLGTGSGAIALAIKHQAPWACVTATDRSPLALKVAQGNAQHLKLELALEHSHWWRDLPPSRNFNLALSNPPYIAEQDPHLKALTHEPLSALTSGPSGLDDLTQIIEHARPHLRPHAWLLLEHGYDQAPAVQALLQQYGFDHIHSRQDLGGQWRCTGGQITIYTPRT